MGGHLLITWPGGGSYRNFDLPNIFFPPPPPLYINNDRSLTAYLHQLYFSFFSPPAVVTCAYKAAIFFNRIGGLFKLKQASQDARIQHCSSFADV